jgi:hypothetical protein
MVKKRLPILKIINIHGYTFPIQAKIVQCEFLIYNLIRVNQEFEDEFDAEEVGADAPCLII